MPEAAGANAAEPAGPAVLRKVKEHDLEDVPKYRL